MCDYAKNNMSFSRSKRKYTQCGRDSIIDDDIILFNFLNNLPNSRRLYIFIINEEVLFVNLSNVSRPIDDCFFFSFRSF
jgi:hypothetical protein